jgi:hypothetical protein
VIVGERRFGDVLPRQRHGHVVVVEVVVASAKSMHDWCGSTAVQKCVAASALVSVMI